MRCRRSQWMLLALLAALSACTSAEPGEAGNTELNVIVPNGYDAGSSAPALIDIQDVEYTVDCAGNSDTFLDNNASFPDEVTLNGNLEVQDGRTNPLAIYGDPAFDGQAEIWQGFMDLPPGPCTIELRARDDDGEVICTAQEPFIIAADTLTKVNIVLICDISFQAPVGMLDVDGTFSFNVGNFCPDLFILNCMDSAPAEQVVLPPPNPPLAGTGCQVRFRDGDSSCGAGCDPQTCVPNGTAGLTCTPGPDPGVSTTITCTDGWLDCQGDGIPDPSCTFNGDTEGTLGQQPPAFPGAPGVGGFFLTCIPPALGGVPGATAICTAVTTDGDLDCDKTKTVQVNCVGDPPCILAGCAPGLDCGFCDDGNDCTSDVCDDSGGTADCPNATYPDGTVCTSQPAPAACQSGVCVSACCNLQPDPDASCDDGNQCTANACLAGCLCDSTDLSSGVACDGGLGPSSGACDGVGACQDICTYNPACPDPGVECQVADCDPVDGTCGSTAGPNGVVCDFTAPGSAEGICTAGTCNFTGGPSCNDTEGGGFPQSQVIGIGCTSNVATAQSPFPWILNVDLPTAIIGGNPFTATFSGVGVFPEFFLDAAQAVVPGGVSQAILEGWVATVSIRSGATGADVPLGVDVGSLSPGETHFCTVAPSTSTVCDPVNDVDPTDPTAGSNDCLPIFPGNYCDPTVFLIATVPTSTDCGPGNTCDLLGKLAQCAGSGTIGDNTDGFCVTGDLIASLEMQTGTFTASASGPVLFGWWENPATDAGPRATGLSTCDGSPDDSRCASEGGVLNLPDGSLALPLAVFAEPTAPLGIRINVAGALFVPIQCAMGADGGRCSATTTTGCLVDGDCPAAETCIGVGVDDDIIMPQPDSALISCPVY